MKAILSATILVDYDDNPRGGAARPVRMPVKLYREPDGLVWRVAGPMGDPAEALPRPATVTHARADFRAVYPVNSAWRPRASWL